MRIKKGTQAYEILKLIEYVREYPRRNLKLLAGKNNWTVRAVKQLIKENYLSINKSKKSRTLRILKNGREALLNAGLEYELDSGQPDRNPSTVERAHRIAEVVTMCIRAGIKVYPNERANEYLSGCPPSLWLVPELQVETHYQYKDSITTSRVIGVLAIGSEKYLAYNTGRRLSLFTKKMEFLVQASLFQNYGFSIDRFLVFGEAKSILYCDNGTTSKKRKSTLLEEIFEGNNKNLTSILDNINHFHFVDLTEDGIKLLKLMQSEYWSYMDQCILTPEEIKSSPAEIVCDGKSEYGPILLMHDMDLARLKMFLNGLMIYQIHHAVIICYRWQMELITSLIKPLLNGELEIQLYAFKEELEGDVYEA